MSEWFVEKEENSLSFGYKVEEIVLPEKIQKISATKIRKEMREKGELK